MYCEVSSLALRTRRIGPRLRALQLHRWVLIAALHGVAPWAGAADPPKIVVAGAAARAPADEIDAVVRQINSPKARKFTLRCWQHGRLVIERTVERMPVGVTDGLQLGDPETGVLTVFQRSASLCLIG